MFPDWEAPVVRGPDNARELIKMRWGMPNEEYGSINTNIRHPRFPIWRRWMEPENRCLIPANSFSEYDDKANPKSLKNPDGTPHPMADKKDVVWFALNPSAHSLHLLASGLSGRARAAPNPPQSRGSTLSTAF